MKLSELLEKYSRKRLRGGSPNTLRLYRHSLSSFAKSLGHDPAIADLTSDKIEDHMHTIIERGGSPASANKDRSQLICLWKWAAEQGIMTTFPDVRPMVEPEQIPMGWMPEEIDRMFAAAKLEAEPVGEVSGRVFWTAMLRVILDSGERIGAVRQLGRDSLQDRFLLIPVSVRKGKRRDRLYQLQPETVAAIKTLLSHHDDPKLFPWPYSESYIYHRFEAILRRAKLPTDRRSKFHRIRRTVASAVARAGGDPTAALDHASPKTTKKYLDPRIVGGVEVSQILANYLRDPTLRTSTPDQKKTG